MWGIKKQMKKQQTNRGLIEHWSQTKTSKIKRM